MGAPAAPGTERTGSTHKGQVLAPSLTVSIPTQTTEAALGESPREEPKSGLDAAASPTGARREAPVWRLSGKAGASAGYGSELELVPQHLKNETSQVADKNLSLRDLPDTYSRRENQQRPNTHSVSALFFSISPPFQNGQKWKWPKKDKKRD